MSLMVAMMLLGSCSDHQQKAQALAPDFVKAWNSDSATFNREMERITAVADSMVFQSLFIDALAQEVQTRGDSAMALGVRLLLNEEPDPVIENFARELVDGLLDNKIDSNRATKMMLDFSTACSKLDRNELWKDCTAAVEDRVDLLDTDDRMLVYSRSTSPADLGKAYKNEKKSDDEIAAEIKALAKIYSPQQMQEFMDAYKSK